MRILSCCAGLALSVWALAATRAAPNSCIQCHGALEWVQDQAWVRMAHDYTNDVHYAAGLSCHDCHGGNPDPKLAEDPLGAMDPDYRANPYRGKTMRTGVPEFCGRCHSDADYMKRFKPEARVDQLKEYWTSQHGKLLRAGDTNVATCVDCHGAHSIRPPSDPQSRVYPTVVAETCGSCHANPGHMAGYKTKTGEPLPTDQYAKWRQSVHARAMFEKDDLSAPTCNDCHGNHGAVPPQVTSITYVCGGCHGREADLFRSNPKHVGFQEHNTSYLPLMDKGGCAACHEPPAPSATITNITEFSECITCHGNHAVMPPTITMLGPLPDTPCAYCHAGSQPAAGGLSEPKKATQQFEHERRALLEQADAAGLQGDARFDWLVDQALKLPMHRLSSSRELGEGASRHAFERLFEKFRIGKTRFAYTDPSTGKTVQEKLICCTDCHGQDSTGFQAFREFSGRMRALALVTARAERTLLAAQRGGVEVRKAHLQLDQAVDSQVQQQVLVHTFNSVTNSPFMQQSAKGLQVARAALYAGDTALDQLRYRRTGLVVSLAIILCVLTGLALKIRELSRSR